MCIYDFSRSLCKRHYHPIMMAFVSHSGMGEMPLTFNTSPNYSFFNEDSAQHNKGFRKYKPNTVHFFHPINDQRRFKTSTCKISHFKFWVILF